MGWSALVFGWLSLPLLGVIRGHQGSFVCFQSASARHVKLFWDDNRVTYSLQTSPHF